MNYELDMKRYEVENTEKWREWCKKMPKLHFKPEWDVTIIPPFGLALTRFCVDYNGKHVSVYFDAYSNLGFMYDENDEPIPYFEIYPNKEGDISRYLLNETDEMMKDIEEILTSN